jgi:hypothetical protein
LIRTNLDPGPPLKWAISFASMPGCKNWHLIISGPCTFVSSLGEVMNIFFRFFFRVFAPRLSPTITLGEARKPKKGLGRFPNRILNNW